MLRKQLVSSDPYKKSLIGFEVNRKEREELMQITQEMVMFGFKNPQTGQEVHFLPPHAGIGTLVKVATSEYIRYFNALKQGSMPPPKPTEVEVKQIAAAAVQRSVTMRNGPTAVPALTDAGEQHAR